MIADSTKAIEKNPDDAEAYRERANAWEEKGDYDQAIADYSKAIELDQGDVSPISTIYEATSTVRKADYDQAIARTATRP